MPVYARSLDKKFPDNRLEGETDLKQGQSVMLRLLKIFAFVCEELGLSYWMISGTLLGAVRHKGFIPWDDDVDVGMSTDQYEEFIKKAPGLLPYDVYLDTSLEFAKLRDRYSSRTSIGTNSRSESLYIDIFPMKRHSFMRKMLAPIRQLIPPYGIPKVPVNAKGFYKFYRIIVFLVAVLIRITGLKYIICFFSLFGSRNFWAFDMIKPMYFHFNDSWFFPLRKYEFEDSLFYGPGNAHEVLRYQYGDYMRLPPEYKRNHHNLSKISVTRSCDWNEALVWEKEALIKKENK